eukprot:CAMPEP_0180154960 /NCGR_PEP_ID=MMETSP0986-20121125/24504_1 /TAXON_ID=697907 /ORGANISM="non described non described, Strain CCMP2293" /LENGTH=228 /DNA_ID=CAMNT_0022103483 /DNA_START=406 /DNA_END=1088 /DNA_ORIENTATION=-
MDGYSSFQPSGGGPPAGSPGGYLNQNVPKNEVVLTLEQARLAKVQKGYIFEPVRAQGDEALPEKRHRANAVHYGYDQPAGSSPARSKPKKPKPPKPASLPQPSFAAQPVYPPPPSYHYEEPAAIPPPVQEYPRPSPAPAHTPALARASSTPTTTGPIAVQKTALQARLRRINAQLEKLEKNQRQQAAAALMPLPATPSAPLPSTGKRKERDSSGPPKEKRPRASVGGG